MIEHKKGITIVIPALNEGEPSSRPSMPSQSQDLNQMGYDTQVLVVDNGSTDATAELAKKAGADVVLSQIGAMVKLSKQALLQPERLS